MRLFNLFVFSFCPFVQKKKNKKHKRDILIAESIYKTLNVNQLSKMKQKTSEEQAHMMLKIQAMILEGDTRLQRTQYSQAANCFLKSLHWLDQCHGEEQKHHVLHCLVSLAKTKLLMGDPRASLQAANRAFEISTDDDKCFNVLCEAVYQKAEAFFHMGDFESALMFFHRGLHLKPKDEMPFNQGVNKCVDAIKQTLEIVDGEHMHEWMEENKLVGDKLRMHAESVQFVEEPMPQIDNLLKPVKAKKEVDVGNILQSGPTNHPQHVHAVQHHHKGSYLDELQEDLDFLQDLHADPAMQHASLSKIHSLITESITYLHARADFWRVREF